MLTALILSAAVAAPPGTHLTGPDGALSWTVTSTADGVTVEGRSPKWTVRHEAGVDLTPRRTVHTDADNGEVVIAYRPDGVDITRRGRTWSLEQSGLWDGDTVDVRLGAEVAAGRTDQAFSVVDPSSGKVYSLDSAAVGDETCGTEPCTHVRVQLTGMLRLVGPTWHYWYLADGQLVRFDGPAGAFAVGGAL